MEYDTLWARLLRIRRAEEREGAGGGVNGKAYMIKLTIVYRAGSAPR